jgi:hypothetical protein
MMPTHAVAAAEGSVAVEDFMAALCAPEVSMAEACVLPMCEAADIGLLEADMV